MRKIVIILLVIIGIAAYLNIGWMIGIYYHNNIFTVKTELAGFAKVAAGADGFFKGGVARFANDKDKNSYCRMFSIFWPFILIAYILSWPLYWITYTLWLIFDGGIVKIIGY